MSAFNVLIPVGLSIIGLALSADNGNRGIATQFNGVHLAVVAAPIQPDTTAPTFTASDTSWPDMLGRSLRYGIDTTVSPCDDFYMYVNGGWRNETTFDPKTPKPHKVSFFGDVAKRSNVRLNAIIDSAHKVARSTNDPNLRVIGAFYESCISADSLNLRTRVVLDSSKIKASLKDTLPRKEQCYAAVKQMLGDGLGQVYLKDVLDDVSLAKIDRVLRQIRMAAGERVAKNPWMTDNDKAASQERLGRLLLRVGVPPQKIDYSGLQLGTNFQDNVRTIQDYYRDKAYRSVGMDNRDQWALSLITPNAFYMGMQHAIEVPPVMFSDPFFNASYDDALNYGAIGHIIAHEIFHSVEFGINILDGKGREEQSNRLKNLHTSMGTVDDWDAYGNRTFREDAADLGGVNTAYAAWKADVKSSGKKPVPLIDGFTPDQRFFLSVARVWRSKWQQIPANGAGDPHGPPFARVNGTLMNMPEFAKAFGCKDTDRMVLSTEKRSAIW